MSRRSESRRQTFDTARLIWDGGQSVRSCLVTDETPRGARLRLVEAETLPDMFELFVTRTGQWKRARVKWRQPSACGVEFLALSSPPQA